MDGPGIKRLSFNVLEGAVTFTAGTLGRAVRWPRMLGHEEMGVFRSRAQPLPPGQPTRVALAGENQLHPESSVVTALVGRGPDTLSGLKQ